MIIVVHGLTETDGDSYVYAVVEAESKYKFGTMLEQLLKGCHKDIVNVMSAVYAMEKKGLCKVLEATSTVNVNDF